MKQIRVIITMLMLTALLTGCPDYDIPNMTVKIKNASKEDIYCYYNMIDTVITTKNTTKETVIQRIIRPNKELNEYNNKSFFDNNNKFNLLIFKSSTLGYYTWQEIQNNNVFDQRYVLTLEDLQKLNFTITYYDE